MKTRQDLRQASLEAACAAAEELKAFLTNQSSDKDGARYRRAKVAATTYAGHSRLSSSENQLAATILQAAKQLGMTASDQQAAMNAVGLLPGVGYGKKS